MTVETRSENILISNQKTLSPLFFLMLILMSIQPSMAESKKLAEIQQWILKNHPDVHHIDNQNLKKIMSTDDLNKVDSVVIFDVREEAEYEVSHISNAIQIDPDIDKKSFLDLYSKELESKTVVFYCSVGRRSSVLAEKVGQDLQQAGAGDVVNLEHGIFGWHNQNFPLESNNINTEYIHPYNRWWGRIIERKEFIRFEAD
jgi:rhodanese-related sulfurtransferase